jgi:hypothetical protein
LQFRDLSCGACGSVISGIRFAACLIRCHLLLGTLGTCLGRLPLRDIRFATRLIRCHLLLRTVGTRLGRLPLRDIRFATRLVRRHLLLGTVGTCYGRLPQRDIRFATGYGRLPLSDIRFVSSGVQAGLFTLCPNYRALILRETGLRVRSSDIHFPIGQVHPVRGQVPVCFGLFGQSHCRIRRLEGLWRATSKIRIGLQ